MMRFNELFKSEAAVQKKILQWAYVIMVASISLLMLIAVLLFAWHFEEATPWREMKAADWGVWAGAFGTVATLAGTIRIATSQRRKIDNEAQVRALLSAGRLMPQVAAVTSEVQRAMKLMQNQINCDEGETLFKRAKSTLTVSHDWPLSAIASLAPLPANCAMNLAQGLGYLHAAEILLNKALAHYLMSASIGAAYRKESAESIFRNLHAAGDMLHRAGSQMSESSGLSDNVTL